MHQVFYESPKRLVKTLNDCIEYFDAERQCGVSRKLTKKFGKNKEVLYRKCMAGLMQSR